MLIKIHDGVVINAKAIVGIMPRYECKDAVYAEAEYSGWWFWKKEVKPRREISPKKEIWHTKLTYISAIDHKEKWIEWHDDCEIDKTKRAKHLTEVVMSFDDNYVNKVFENEVLK